MQPTRVIIRSPHLCGRIAKAPSATRSMSLLSPFGPRFQTQSFPSFPSFSPLSNELAPFFRLMDEMTLATPRFEQFFQPHLRQLPSFQPRFDVREIDGAYELRGELPGVDGKDLEVQFTDAQTLVVRGRTERESTRGTPPNTATSPAAVAAAPAAESTEAAAATSTNAVADTSDVISNHSASFYQKPSVEDDAPVVAEDAMSTPGQATPAESTISEQPETSSVAAAPAQQESAPTPTPEQPTSQYWVSERSTGSFQRTFTFPTRIDQDGVRASLKNGILNVLVPKASVPTARRINVE